MKLNVECLRSWRRDQPQATHHPAEPCCHTAVWSQTPPGVNDKPLESPNKPNLVCGVVPRLIRTFMDRVNCTCLQENMPKTADHLHEFMHGNKTDLLLGFIWHLPPRTGLSHSYPSVLPVVSKCILGKESFYPAGGLQIHDFYTPACMMGLLIALLVYGFITATTKSLLEGSCGQSRYPIVRYFFNLFDAYLMYLTEHFQLNEIHFPGFSTRLLSDQWLHLFWLLGSFLLYTIASNDLINLLISPLESTLYKSLEDIVARNQSNLTVYYFPQSSLDLLIRSKKINLTNPVRVPIHKGYFTNYSHKVFDEEMLHEKSIVVAAWDSLEHLEADYVTFNTYKQLDAEEDSFSYLYTSTTMDPMAEQHFRKVYMHGFVESGSLVHHVSWYRWSLTLGHNMRQASSSDEAPRQGQHFESLKLDGLVEFFTFCAACHLMCCLVFGPIYVMVHRHNCKVNIDRKRRQREKVRSLWAKSIQSQEFMTRVPNFRCAPERVVNT